MTSKVTTHNAIPYFIMIVMAILLYFAYQSNQALKEENEEMTVSYSNALSVVSQDVYLLQQNQNRALRANSISKQPKGKYEMVIVQRSKSSPSK